MLKLCAFYVSAKPNSLPFDNITSLLYHFFNNLLQITEITQLCITVCHLLSYKLTCDNDIIPDTDLDIDGSMVLKCILDRSVNQQLQRLNFA